MERHSQAPPPAGDGEPWPAAFDDAAAFDLLLAYEQRVLEGAPDDFEALCAARPELASALRRLRAAPTPDAHPPLQATVQHRTPSSRTAQDSQDLLSLAGADRTRAARYERRGELGRGAMGVVYEVWDRELARLLAMKVLAASSHAARDPLAHAQRLRRFLREVRTAAQLDHPGIVPVHDFGSDEQGRPFFTMKRVQGRELKAVFAEVWSGASDWTLARAVGALLKVCEAVEYAHSKGVVHRDLKPANVMIGPFGEVFVMDWGVAHLFDAADTAAESSSSPGAARGADGELTGDGDVIGTASYMAPEQAQGRLDAIGPAIDVYALGAMLYHLLAERAPYVEPRGSNSSVVVMARLLEGPPQPLARVASKAPAELVAIAEKAMARAVEQRYSCMGALAADLRDWLEGRVVGAHDSGAWAQLKKWVLRNRAFSAASAVAVLALTSGSGAVAYIESVRADEALAAGEKIRVEALTAQRTVDFFVDVFHGVAPSRGGGQVTVAEMLDDVARSLAQRLEDEPAVRARVGAAIGSAYLGLGLHRQALELLSGAQADAVAAFGLDASVVRDIQLRHAAAAISARELSRARTALEALTPPCAAAGDATVEQKLRHAQLLATVERESGQPDRALARLTDAAFQLADLSPDALSLEGQACDLLIALGRLDDARERSEALAVRADQAGAPHVRVAALCRIARLALQRGDWDAAAALFESALAAQRAASTSDDSLLAQILNESAFLAVRRQEFERAQAQLREVLAIHGQSLGETHPMTLTACSSLADVLLHCGRLDESEALAERARSGWVRIGGELTVAWSTALRVLAEVNAARGRWESAEMFAEERFSRSPPERQGDTRQLLDTILERRRELSDG